MGNFDYIGHSLCLLIIFLVGILPLTQCHSAQCQSTWIKMVHRKKVSSLQWHLYHMLRKSHFPIVDIAKAIHCKLQLMSSITFPHCSLPEGIIQMDMANGILYIPALKSISSETEVFSPQKS